MAAIGIAAGIILGLVYGWLISPVEVIDLSIAQLRDDLKTEYLRITIDSYTLNQDDSLAEARYDRLGEDAKSYLAEIKLNPSGQSVSEIDSFHDVVDQATLGEELEEIAVKEKSGNNILKLALLVTIVLAAALVFRYFLGRRSLSKIAPKSAVGMAQESTSKMEPTYKTKDLVSIIEANNLTKYYGKARGIVDVSFNVEKGEIFGFIGPNGAGKSTTIRLLCSLIYPSSGEAKIFGKDAIKYGPEIRQEIGYLPSEVFYYDRMKVIDLLKYSASFYNKDCTERLYELAEIMELDLQRRIDDLSYGNKKKVGIVQGLLHQPKVLLLDEPTSGLDPLMQKKFYKLIREENERGVTVFLSSHILGVVQKMCNRVAIIREGSIVDVQDVRTLQRDNYKKVHIVADEIDEKRFNVPGVINLEKEKGAVSFFYKGDINRITREISEQEVSDVTIEEPTLEEIFMHYYE